ncbi:MAG: hypothetical protein ABI652_00965 [Acidobacteriota bacterium]
MASTFNSPIVSSAYYYRGRGASRRVCRSAGFNLLFSVQAATLELLQDVGTLPSAGGTSLSAEQMRVISGDNPAAGPGWDELTLRAIYSYVQFSASRSQSTRTAISSFLSSIAQDLLVGRGSPGRPLSQRAMQAAMWMLDSTGFTPEEDRVYGIGSPDDVSFQSGTVFPTFGQIPPLPTNWTPGVTFGVGPGDCSSIAEGASASDPITATATFGASTWLIIGLLGATVVAIGAATRGSRSNPTPRGDEEEFSRRRNLPGVKTTWMPSPRFSSIILVADGREIGKRTESHRDGYVRYSLPTMKAATR